MTVRQRKGDQQTEREGKRMTNWKTDEVDVDVDVGEEEEEDEENWRRIKNRPKLKAVKHITDKSCFLHWL